MAEPPIAVLHVLGALRWSHQPGPAQDEARHESLYELEIALRQIPETGGHISPWLIDRLLRNLLVDVTGNTHRAEICIDKLYSPDGPMGRLGLVEFRAFEMPPHPRMSLAQQLLVRALGAWFWERPYRQTLVRWGTALHDRFMLPHFLWADLEKRCRRPERAGFPSCIRVVRPSFRLPFSGVGRVQHAGIDLELRHALEPWLVLGEQSDSGAPHAPSIRRSNGCKSWCGATGDRFTVACNGYDLPLTNTATWAKRSPEYASALSPNDGFHPTIRRMRP